MFNNQVKLALVLTFVQRCSQALAHMFPSAQPGAIINFSSGYRHEGDLGKWHVFKIQCVECECMNSLPLDKWNFLQL